MSATPETTLPELPEDKFPEWADTLRSQVTSSGMMIPPDLLPPLMEGRKATAGVGYGGGTGA